MTRDKTKKIFYWITTLWLSFSMVMSAIFQLFRIKGGHEFIIHELGYPSYFLTIIGVWKLLGVVTILVPRLALAKEWAYAGFFFVATGAVASHVASHSGAKDIFPAALLIVLVVASWSLRPAGRKIAARIMG